MKFKKALSTVLAFLMVASSIFSCNSAGCGFMFFGPSRSGKTSVIRVLTNQKFEDSKEKYTSKPLYVIGERFLIYDVNYVNQSLCFLRMPYLIDVFVLDASEEQQTIEKQVESFTDALKKNGEMILVINKMDIAKSESNLDDIINGYAEKWGVAKKNVFFTSARTGENISKLNERIENFVSEKIREQASSNSIKIDIGEYESKKFKKGLVVGAAAVALGLCTIGACVHKRFLANKKAKLKAEN